MASQTDALLVTLNTTNLQKTDNRLYQVLRDLITNLLRAEQQVTAISATIAPVVAGGITQLTGDVTAIGPGSVPATLSNTGVVAGTYGDASNIPQFTVDAKGRLSSASNVPISSQDYVVMSDGANPPSPMDDGNGNFIYVTYTP